ncbi:MAG: HAD family hydrolase [Candidatus Saccharimonadales bacterium]
MKRFAVFDIDGTLVRWQLYHAIADALARLGYFDAEAFQAVRQARMIWKQRDSDQSFKAYEDQLIASYEQMLGQLTVKQLEEAVSQVFDEYKDQVYTYTRDLIKRLKTDNYLLFAISNSQTEIVQKIAEHYGFDDFAGAVYERQGHKFSGQKTLYLKDKDRVLKQLAAKHQASWQSSIAVGDSASDAPMLKAVEQPIAFNPEKKLYQLAKARGWPVVVERKNVIYKLESKDGKYFLA